MIENEVETEVNDLFDEDLQFSFTEEAHRSFEGRLPMICRPTWLDTYIFRTIHRGCLRYSGNTVCKKFDESYANYCH